MWFYSTSEVSESKCSVMSDSLRPHGLHSPRNSPGQNTGVGSLSLLQGIFPTQRPNPGLPHCKRILYQLSHKGSPRTLEWIAYPFACGSSQPDYPFSSGSSQPRLSPLQQIWRTGSGRSAREGIGYPLQYSWASLVAQLVKNPL